MKRVIILTAVLALGAGAQAANPRMPEPTVYIVSDGGFQDSLAAAIEKKQVPVSLSTDASLAQYRMEATPLKVKSQTTGSKVARCIFADCIGIQDSSTVSVKLVDSKSKEIVWAYSVHKQWGSSRNDQSMAEAVAKHLKQYIQKHPLASTPPQS